MTLPESAAPDEFREFERRGWDSAARHYHSEFGRLTAQAADPMLDAAGVGAGTRLIDLASGPGYVAGRAAARGAIVIGTDLAQSMVTLASANWPGVEFRVADAEALGLADASFDAVTAGFLLGHLARPGRVLAEVRRVLRRGGRFATTWWAPFDRAVGFGIAMEAIRAHGRTDVPLPPAPPFDLFNDPTRLASALEEAGFAEVKVDTLELRWPLPSGEALFGAFLDGTVRTAGLLRAQSPEALAAIRAAVIAGAERWRVGEGIELPMAVLLASGRC